GVVVLIGSCHKILQPSFRPLYPACLEALAPSRLIGHWMIFAYGPCCLGIETLAISRQIRTS
ncbi:MAG: hypothetical protein ACU4EQ_10775, partial [Candidatus Nitrosoglobus sp.]